MKDEKRYQVRFLSKGKLEETPELTRSEAIEVIFMYGGESIQSIFCDGEFLNSEKTLSLLRDAKVFSN